MAPDARNRALQACDFDGFRRCYAELKDRLAAGTPLSREELDYIGSNEERRSERGWHQPDQLAALAPLYEVDAEPDPADAEVLQSLMSVGSSQERLEFMGSAGSRPFAPDSPQDRPGTRCLCGASGT